MNQSTDFPEYFGFWFTKEDLSQNPNITFSENIDESKSLSLPHKMMPHLKDISKLDGHISPEPKMRRTIHDVVIVLHEKVRQSVIENILAKYGTSTVQADRVSTSKQKYLSTFVTYAPQNIDNRSKDRRRDI